VPSNLVADTVKSQIDTVIDTVNDTVFSLMKQDKHVTAKEMSERLGISLSTVRRKIKELRDTGKIERIGSDKSGYWKLLKQGD
jgi:ATP-dependent DNA helicase RecG